MNAKTFINKRAIPEFYKEVFNTYRNVFWKPISNARQVLLESVWQNDFIKVDNRPVFISRMYESGIRVIEDMLDTNRCFLSFNQFRERFPRIGINYLQFQSLKRAIPTEWKNLITCNHTAPLSRQEKNCCLINVCANKVICLKVLNVKHVYLKLIEEVRKVPTGQRKWEDEGFRNQSWRKIYEIPFRCCKSTKLQSLHYRIIHRYIPTRKFLFSRSIIGSNLCPECYEIDNLQHFFYTCNSVRSIWDHILPQIQNIFNLPNNFIDIKTVLFGYTKAPLIVDLLLLLCKQYILSCKLGTQNRITIAGALHVIENHYHTEKATAKARDRKEKFTARWAKVIDNNGINFLT